MASLASSPGLVPQPATAHAVAAPAANRLSVRQRLRALFGRKEAPPSWLTSEQLKALVKRKPHIVKEIYEIAQRQLLAEGGRQSRLDAKAASLLSAVGLCLTVTFTFGGLLLTQATAFHDKVGGWRLDVIKWSLFAAVLCALWAGGFAIKALLVRDKYRAIGEDTVFNPTALDVADNEDDAEIGLSAYRRFVLVQIWDNARRHGLIHEAKARDIRKGQVCFMLFVFLLMPILISVATAAK
jgi:hypothetical protein